MTIIIGAERIGSTAEQAKEPKKSGGPNKADLLAEAEALGLVVPEGATKQDIKALIDEAKAASEA